MLRRIEVAVWYYSVTVLQYYSVTVLQCYVES
jgi:hypothetical protein